MAALGVERGTLLMPQQLGFEREAEEVLRLARDRAEAGASAGGLSHRLVDAWIAVRLMRVTALRTIGELVAGAPPGPRRPPASCSPRSSTSGCSSWPPNCSPTTRP